MGKLLGKTFSKYMKSLCAIDLGDNNGNIINNFTKQKDENLFPALEKCIKC